jgi:predicted ABC-type ATPase
MPTDCTKAITEFRRDPMSFFLTATLSSDKKISAVIENRKGGKYMVCLTINGVEVDVERAVKRFSDGIDEAINKRALEVAQEKCSDIITTVNDLQKAVKKAMKKRLGMKLTEDDWE